jgi:hypothetical protein
MRRSFALAPTIAVLALVGCGGSSSPQASSSSPPVSTDTTTPPAATATAPADVAAATAAVKTDWTTFFLYKTPRATQISLLEHGDTLGPAVKFAARLQAKQHLKQVVKVTKVTFTSPTQASIIYALLNGTTTLLGAANGTAVLDGGTWKVSEATFCTLVTLGNGSKPVPSCPS